MNESVIREQLKEIGSFCKSCREDKGIKQRYNLAYTEFIALDTHVIQKQGKIIKELKNEIDSLQKQINSLEQKIN